MGVIRLILLDTHVLAWAAEDGNRLSRAAASEIRRARRGGGLAISAISLWELSWLLSRGRIQSGGTIEATIRRMIEGVAVLPITPEIAALASQFPEDYPSDPSDRLIGATARAEGLPLVTRDERIRRSPLVRTVWLNFSYILRDAGEGARAPHNHLTLVVILQPQMRDQLFAFQVPQRVLQLHQLDEQIVLRIQARCRHRRFEVEA